MTAKPREMGMSDGIDGRGTPSRRERTQANMERLLAKHRRSFEILEAYDKEEIARPRVRKAAKT